MIPVGAMLHDVVRSQGRYDDAGDWNPAYQVEEFSVLGCLQQTTPRMVMLDPMNPRAVATWRLVTASGEREILIASTDDARMGDRVRHGDKLLAVVGMIEIPGGISEYTLIDPGQDPTEVQS